MASITKRSFLFVLVGLCCASIASAEANRQRGSALPLLQVPFIQNQGQIADAQVLFYARTFGGTVYVTAAGQLVYALPRAEGGGLKRTVDRRPLTVDEREQTTEIGSEPTAHSPQSTVVPQMALIRETLVDADLAALPTGAERSGAMINSFIGNDPRRWQANIPSFCGVQFGDIYDGISLEVRATGNNVEKIFTVAPGADPARIALRLDGADGVSITPAGELEARTTLGPVRFTAPVAYQRGADGERQSVSVAYALEGDQVGFCVGAFDAARPLVIDPLLASTFIGGTSNNVIRAMAMDSQTNVLVAGYTASTDFPTTNSYDASYNGGSYDGFIAKFDPQLTSLLSATYLGGVGEDAIMAMAINTNNGDVYVAGYTASTNFPMQAALYANYNGGAYDGFVSVLNSNLTALKYSTYLGGTNVDMANVDMAYALALSAGSTPDVFVAGLTASTNFPIANTFGVSYQTNLACSTNIPVITNDVFVARFNTDLSINLASTYLGGTNDDGARGLALDTNGFVYLTGYTTSSDFPVTNGYDQVYNGARDAFVAKLPITLTNLVAATFLGGTSDDAANAISVAPFTNIVCVVGYTYSANFPQSPVNNVMAPGYTNRFRGGKDAFLTRLDLLLTNIAASTFLGGTGDDEATAVLTYADGITNSSLRIYVAGWTTSSNFPVTTNAYDTIANGGRDAFVSYFGTGATLQASTYLGGATNDSAYAMALQLQPLQTNFYYNSLFVAGCTASTNFPTTLRAYDNDRTGQTNDYGFVTKLGAGLAYGTIKWQVTLSDPDTSALAGTPSIGWDGTVYCGFGTNLYAFDAQGRQRWKTSCAGKLVDQVASVTWGMGTMPAVSTNGTIYVTTDSPGSLQAISPTGGVIWTFSANNSCEFSSPAIGRDGTIYFGTFGNLIYAVRDNGTNASELWHWNFGQPIYSSPAVDTNGNVYFAHYATPGFMRSYNTNGVFVKEWTLVGPTYSSPTIGSNGWVYIGSGNTLYGFNPNSTTSRTWATAGQIYGAPTIGSNGNIYVGGGTNLYEFYANGTSGKVWATDGQIQSSATVDRDGSIIVGSYNTGLYSFNPNGTTNWILPLVDYVHYNSSLIRSDGTIYMTDEHNLYAICGTAPTMRPNWPTPRHDVLRTGNAAFDAARFLKPTGLTVSKGTYSDRVLVNWNGNANADYYQLMRNSSNDLASAQSLGGQLLTNSYVDIFDPSMKGLIYYYWVQVVTPVAASDFSDPDSGGVPPDPPTGVVASKGEPPHTNEIVITWNASANATTYALYQSQTNANNTAALLAITTNVTAYTNAFPNITRGLTYYYWVMAGNGAAGTSGFSAGDGVINSGGTPPLAPAGIMATTNSSHAVYVTWSASDYAAMYAVYRNESPDIPAGFMAVTAVTNFADTTAASLRNYYYWVRATNQYGLSEFSAMANGWRLLVPPQNVHASKGDYLTKIRVSWDLEPAATSYVVWRNSTNDPSTATNLYETVSTATNYDDLVITRGAGYYYWVQSVNSYGGSEFSDPDIGGTVPYPPLNVSATDGADYNPVIVTWDAVPGGYATGYQIFRQDSYTPWLLTTPLGIASGTTYSDVAARPGLRYYYWVASTNQFGPSDLSGFDTGYRPLAPPYAISASDGLYADHLYVNWSISDNASVYELWRGTNSDSSAARMLVNAVATNFYDDTDSVQGVLYYYWVKAKTLQFVSGFSPYDSGYRALRRVDIGVSDLVFLPTRMAIVGAPAAVSFRVTNYGVQNMAEPNAWVACNFYISSNSVFGDADDKWMGGTNLSIPLAVGNSTVVVLPKAIRESLAVPAVVVPGVYHIFVNIQHAAPTKWLDPNPGNNTISRNGGVIKIITKQPAGLQLVNDFNGDGYTDMAMYRESTGTWQIWLFGTQGITVAGYGGPGFKAVPRDYDGDGKTDLAVYQEATGTWKIWFSSGNYALASVGGWGGPGFEPVPCDYDGDGRADPAVYQESTGTWQIWFSANGYATESVPGLGGPGWRPVTGDFDGDAKADPTLYQESTGTWLIWRSIWQYAPVAVAGLGGPGYRPVAADYDLDGIMDPSVFQANTGSWWAWLSASGYAAADASVWGNAGTVAVPGDYDGDGLADPAVYWDSFGMWRLWLSSTGYQPMEILAWPGDGFRPIWP